MQYYIVTSCILKTPVAMIKTLELVLIGEKRYRCYCDGAIISDTMCVLNPVATSGPKSFHSQILKLVYSSTATRDTSGK